jgi:hypothetical protein
MSPGTNLTPSSGMWCVENFVAIGISLSRNYRASANGVHDSVRFVMPGAATLEARTAAQAVEVPTESAGTLRAFLTRWWPLLAALVVVAGVLLEPR